jgi:hypothetical protein
MTIWNGINLDANAPKRELGARLRYAYVYFLLVDRFFTDSHPWMHPEWTGPTDPDQALPCDIVMVALGEILAAESLRLAVKRSFQ